MLVLMKELNIEKLVKEVITFMVIFILVGVTTVVVGAAAGFVGDYLGVDAIKVFALIVLIIMYLVVSKQTK